jgi:DNA repair protein RadA/Sms
MSRTAEPVPGTAITVAVEGKRPLLGEVQALVSKSGMPQPRRAVSGLDSARVAMVLAVLEKRGGLKLGDKDVYTATVGGMKITEPAIDLAVVLAIASSVEEVALSPRLVSVGEVGLAGEVRRVPNVARRLAEAARLGFTHALVPPDSGRMPDGIRALEVANVASALNAASHAR